MLSNKAGYSFVFFLTFVLIFACAIGAGAQSAKSKKTVKKPAASKKGQAAPTLKPAATGKVKEKAAPASESTVTPAAKTEAKEHSAEIPNASDPHAGDPAISNPEPRQNPATANPKAAAKADAKTDARAEVTEKAAPAKAPASAASAKTAKTKAKGKPVAAAAKSPAAKKSEPKKETVAAGKKAVKEAAKETGPKKKIAVAAVTAEKKPGKEAAPVKAKPEETVLASAPSKTWLPPISADQLRADLNGKTVTDILSEEPGDGRVDWLFAGSQPKDVEILKVDRSEDVRIVEARLTAKKTHPNLDGSFERVRGTARFHYERGGKGWELLYIENVSLRHSDTSLDGPVRKQADTPPVTNTTASVISAPPVNIIPGASLDIGAGKYQSYSFQVRDTAVVTGKFRARGGPQNDIEAYILDQDGFANWTNDHSAPAYYNSGRLTVGSIETVLSPGTYYLVFNNRYSAGDRKTVEAGIQLRTDPASLASALGGSAAPVNYSGPSAGITSVRRTYAPSANPVQPYVRPAQNVEAAVARKPISPAPRVSEVAAYSDEVVLSDRFDIGGGRHYAIPFSVKTGGAVRGTFNVAGGEIDAYIMTAAQYNKWTATREGVLDYSSGRVSGGSINRSLNPGDYYLVFSNRYSMREPKTVRAEIQVEYLPR